MKSHALKILLVLLSLLVVGQSQSAESDNQIHVDDDTFKCLADMSTVDGIAYVFDNLLGNMEATIAAASSSEGGKFPPGTVISLVPVEAMVKHNEGWNPATNDWEFFLLDITEQGSSIKARGTANVVNKIGSCLGCHQLARPEWDFVCSNDHGCAPIASTREQLQKRQASDPRCNDED